LFQLLISNCGQKLPPVICGADCQQKNVFEDAAFYQDERPKLKNLELKDLGLSHIGNHFFAIGT
jgi:hypothetical protein